MQWCTPAVVYTSGPFHFFRCHVFAFLWSMTSFQGLKTLLHSIQPMDTGLLEFIDDRVDKCSHDIQCRVLDNQILQRQLIGPPCTPGVAHVRPKPKKNPAKREGGEANDNHSPKLFRPDQQSPISGIVAKPFLPPPKGKGDHLPQSEKTYCEYCNKWIAKGSFSQHRDAQIHKTNEESLKRSGSKCKCDNSLVIVLLALKTFLADTWCPTCNKGFVKDHDCGK